MFCPWGRAGGGGGWSSQDGRAARGRWPRSPGGAGPGMYHVDDWSKSWIVSTNTLRKLNG